MQKLWSRRRGSRAFSDLRLLAFAAVWGLAPMTLGGPRTPRVAVFFEPGFQSYKVSPLVSPRAIAASLVRAGIPAETLDARRLADPAQFNARWYSALVMPYGNAFPLEAAGALRRFHLAGGTLVLSGVPLTHPMAREGDGWRDLGHTDRYARFGPEGIGVGGFTGPVSGSVQIAAGDALHLGPLGYHPTGTPREQALDRRAFPSGIDVVPLLLESREPLAAMIVHRRGPFQGAVDVWTLHPDAGELEPFLSEQMLARGVVLALQRRGAIGAPAGRRAFAALDRLPRPARWAGIGLPALPRPYPTLQPKTPPPALHLYVADVRRLSFDERRMLTCLQGLVNRTQPRIYLVSGDDDRFWLDVMQRQGSTGTPVPVSDPLSLVDRFRSSIRGAVVPDPSVYASACVAVDLAGLEDLVVAPPVLAHRLRIPIREDLRGRFRDDTAAYRWVRTHLLARMNRYLCLSLDPSIHDSGALDTVVAARGLCFWITGPRGQRLPGADMRGERAEMEATFARLPLGAVVRGYWWHGDQVGIDETPGVTLGSRFGKITVVSDYIANDSVLSGVRIARLTQKPRPPVPPLDPAKLYVAVTISDGDNLCTWRGFFRRQFEDPLHGSFPIGWGIGPTLIDTAPTQARWYYEHAAPNDEFLCDVSGVGYINPADWATALRDREGAFRGFYGWTQTYLDRMDLKTVRLNLPTREAIARAGRDLPRVRFLLPDYGYSGERSYAEMTYTLPTGQSVFRAVTNTAAPGMAAQIRARAGTVRPAFVNAFLVNWGMRLGEVKAMLDSLGPDAVPVTPSQLDALYREAKRRGLAR